ncbi:hypothetical protein AAG747_16065 [Rapidithrix thailandica]|uniref:Uncharacterized protein n=1 Tax=Rapidithrix thailandica TaxID=413964 RepID=A0AAW9SAT0_9BACT
MSYQTSEDPLLVDFENNYLYYDRDQRQYAKKIYHQYDGSTLLWGASPDSMGIFSLQQYTKDTLFVKQKHKVGYWLTSYAQYQARKSIALTASELEGLLCKSLWDYHVFRKGAFTESCYFQFLPRGKAIQTYSSLEGADYFSFFTWELMEVGGVYLLHLKNSSFIINLFITQASQREISANLHSERNWNTIVLNFREPDTVLIANHKQKILGAWREVKGEGSMQFSEGKLLGQQYFIDEGHETIGFLDGDFEMSMDGKLILLDPLNGTASDYFVIEKATTDTLSVFSDKYGEQLFVRDVEGK